MNFFDLHNDTVFELKKQNLKFNNKKLAVNLSETEKFERFDCHFALWIKDDIKAPYTFYKVLLNDYREKILSFKSDKFVPHLAVEGGAVVENNPERIIELSNDGVEYLTLTWNGKNSLAAGVLESGGITELGKETIKIMNSKKMVCDLSHINRQGFYEALEIAKYPIITHTALSSVNNHVRNINDQMADEIKLKSGIIGLCFYPEFLGGDDVFLQFAKHLYKGLELGLINNLAVGSDFDGAKSDKKLKTVGKVKVLKEYLLKNVCDRDTIEKIFSKNAQNYFKSLTKQ